MNTSHLFCRNCTGCLSDAVSTSNWQHWCLSRYTAAHRRISQTRVSRCLRPVAVSARLAPSHASYRGPERVCMGDRSFDVAGPRFGTSCLLHCGHLTVSANSEVSWKRFCLSRLRRLVTLAFRRRIQIFLLTYLFTYLHMLYSTVSWPWVILSDLAKYSMTRSVARSLCDSWASCL